MPGDQIQKLFDQQELKKISLSVKRSVVESFKFNGKNIRAFYIKDIGQCLISQDVYTAVVYDKENGVKTEQRLVPKKKQNAIGRRCDRYETGRQKCPPSYTVLLKEPGLYCFLLRCKRDEVESFMEWAVETVFPREVRKLASAIEEKDNQIQAIKYENVALQAQRDVCQDQLRKCQNTIIHLKTRYVDHANDPGKDNIVQKHTTPANNKFHDLPYCVARIQRRKRYVKLRWFDRHFPDHDVIAEIYNPNSIHAFNRFKEEGHVERRYNHFRLIDLI